MRHIEEVLNGLCLGLAGFVDERLRACVYLSATVHLTICPSHLVLVVQSFAPRVVKLTPIEAKKSPRGILPEFQSVLDRDFGTLYVDGYRTQSAPSIGESRTYNWETSNAPFEGYGAIGTGRGGQEMFISEMTDVDVEIVNHYVEVNRVAERFVGQLHIDPDVEIS